MIWDDLHYNTNRTRTHNCDVNILISARESGKSTGVLRMILEDYLKTGWRSVWLLRQKSQLNKDFYETFLNDFEEYPFMMYRNEVYKQLETDPTKPDLEEGAIVTFGAVSTGNKDFKQTKLKKVLHVIYDEFLIDHNLANERYLSGEAQILFKIWDTIQRRSQRKTKLWLLGNPYSFVNPYFSWLKIEGSEVEKRKNRFYKPYKKVLVYYFDTHPELLEQKDETTYGMLSKLNKDYYEHTWQGKTRYRNAFHTRDFHSLGRKEHMLTLKIDNATLEIWRFGLNFIYATTDVYKSEIPIAIDFDSFNNESTFYTRSHPKFELIQEIKRRVTLRQGVYVANSFAEELLRLLAKTA